jgi:hypothetical protein
VGWVGTWDDIVEGREGQYRVRLEDNHHEWDCAYPGVEILPDGTILTTTYVKYTDGPEKHSVVSVRFTIADGQAVDVQVLNNPDDPASGYSALDPAATYKVATTNYQGLYASGYKDLFAQAEYVDTAIDVRDEVRSFIQGNSPVTASLDGRLATGAPASPEAVPEAGGEPLGPLTVLLVGVVLVAAGLLQRRVTMDRAD